MRSSRWLLLASVAVSLVGLPLIAGASFAAVFATRADSILLLAPIVILEVLVYAPYGAARQRIAVAVILENAGYGGTAAAPLAGEIVIAASALGLPDSEAAWSPRTA